MEGIMFPEQKFRIVADFCIMASDCPAMIGKAIKASDTLFFAYQIAPAEDMQGKIVAYRNPSTAEGKLEIGRLYLCPDARYMIRYDNKSYSPVEGHSDDLDVFGMFVGLYRTDIE